MSTFKVDIVNNDQPHTIYINRENAEEAIKAVWELYGMGVYIGDVTEVADDEENR